MRERPHKSEWPIWKLIGGSALAIIAVFMISGGIAYHVSATPSDEAGWVQAIGSIIAIVSAVAIALWQHGRTGDARHAENVEAAQAAHRLAYEALETISDRLEVALAPAKPIKDHALRGYRTSEMVTAMREVDTGRVPTTMLPDFIKLRSQVFAINSRISELYERENQGNVLAAQYAVDNRYAKLGSAVRVLSDARATFAALEAAAEDFGVSAMSFDPRYHVQNYQLPD